MESAQNRKELIAKYKELEHIAGVYRIINNETKSYYLGTSSDIQGVFNKLEFAKKIGSTNPLPQKMRKDISENGLDNFSVEILEVLEVKPGTDEMELKKELKLLKDMYREANGADMEY